MLNIWLFPKWYPNRTDPQLGVFIQKHAKAIAVNHRVSVLYVHSVDELNSGYEIQKSRKENVNEIIVYFRRNSSRLSNIVKFFYAFRMGLKILKTESPKPDIIHSYILLRTGIIAWYLSARRSIPFIVSEQWSGYVTGKFEKESFIKKYFSRLVIKNAGALTSVSKFLLSGMNSYGLTNKNSFVVPNTIEISNTDFHENKNEVINILLVADLVDEIKNISSVLRVIAKAGNDSALIRKFPFRLNIVGHGKDERQLKQLSSDLKIDRFVSFEGLKTNEEVYEYLHRCDFLIMNSNFETFSLICAEAMSCGKPVIATRCGGPDEFITPETGMLITPGNEGELHDAFIKMLESFTLFDSRKIIAYATNLFSKNIAGEEFEKAYSAAMKASK